MFIWWQKYNTILYIVVNLPITKQDLLMIFFQSVYTNLEDASQDTSQVVNQINEP